jgi:hypothetical protein
MRQQQWRNAACGSGASYFHLPFESSIAVSLVGTSCLKGSTHGRGSTQEDRRGNRSIDYPKDVVVVILIDRLPRDFSILTKTGIN